MLGFHFPTNICENVCRLFEIITFEKQIYYLRESAFDRPHFDSSREHFWAKLSKQNPQCLEDKRSSSFLFNF